MNILIIGNGGREHALAWKAAQSPLTTKIFVAPGNAGTATEQKTQNINIDVLDILGLIEFAKSESIALTIVGPEAPLVVGIVDQFNAAGLKCLGPNQAAAQLEGSKVFTKQFLEKYSIPTADYSHCTSIGQANDYIQSHFSQHNTPLVIKADGLAAGKGVVIVHDKSQATIVVDEMLSQHKFGQAGHEIVIEQFLTGEEASFIVLIDGKTILPLATSQDHKARDNNDQGPNTGGMGAYSPAPVITPAIHDRIMQTVIQPTIDGLANEGITYTGFLYAGLMIDKSGDLQVLEYNCRFGDPETQPILLRLNSDFIELCLAAVNQTLNEINIQWDPRPALGVVLAAGGYPENYRKGDTITGLPQERKTDRKVFHAGTTLKDHHVVTNGGRVLCCTALGDSVTIAQKQAYSLVNMVHWDNMCYRTDIGYRAIQREQI